MTLYGYLIHRTDEDTDDDRRTMSRGTRTSDQSPAELADELLATNRAQHSYYTGPRRCWVWELTDGTFLPRTAPEDAVAYDG
ncbi:hypothetical protein [Streptomyces sp. NPDC050145]|uniref:hypothetical protein n=1 Tax=Streptomyces sp. NPDC050145 TaxID=3365602 RepID=UPI0037B641E1